MQLFGMITAMDTQDQPLTVSELAVKLTSTEALRKDLRVEEAVRDLNDVGLLLRSQWQTMTRNQIDANKLRVELARIKLAKALPDLKSMEHSTGSGENDKVQFIINLDGGNFNGRNEKTIQ